MKKLLIGLALALLTSSALAVDNGIVFTPGAGGIARSKDIGVGVQLPGVFLSDQTGAFPGAFTTYGTSPGAVLVPSMNAFVTNTPAVTISGTAGVTQSTSPWVTSISGTVPLPTGASTAALQPTSNAVAGTTTAGTTGTLAFGAVTTGSPTYTTANTNPLSLDTAGNLRVNVVAGGGAGGTSSSFGSAFPATGTAIGLTSGTNMVAWSATTNYGTAPAAIAVPAVNAFVTNSNANGRAVNSGAAPAVLTPALTTFHLIAANTTNATSVKASGATLYSCQMSNNSATAGYLKIYNKASAPTVGTDIPVKTLIIPGPAAGGGGSNISFGSGGGLTLGTGFALAVTGVITDADTTAVAAATFAINCDYE